jgi:hypothetical protein
MMAGRSFRYLVPTLLVVVAAGALFVLSLAAQPERAVNPNERYVKPEANVQDGSAGRNSRLWVLDFKFKDPRLIKVNVPGRGQRVCWYLWYQVINYTGEPRTFVPDFELVTHDTGMVYQDIVLPAAQEAIAKLEDPTGYYKIKNSVTIAAEPIPASLPRAAPRPVTGVAIWIDPNEPAPDDDAATKKRKADAKKLADSNRYSIFVAGLSNGWALTDPIPPDTRPVVRRKTLQLNFKRLGDRFNMKSDEIRFQAPAQWMYRGSPLKITLPTAKDEKGKKIEDGKDKKIEGEKDKKTDGGKDKKIEGGKDKKIEGDK